MLESEERAFCTALKMETQFQKAWKVVQCLHNTTEVSQLHDNLKFTRGENFCSGGDGTGITSVQDNALITSLLQQCSVGSSAGKSSCRLGWRNPQPSHPPPSHLATAPQHEASPCHPAHRTEATVAWLTWLYSRSR